MKCLRRLNLENLIYSYSVGIFAIYLNLSFDFQILPTSQLYALIAGDEFETIDGPKFLM